MTVEALRDIAGSKTSLGCIRLESRIPMVIIVFQSAYSECPYKKLPNALFFEFRKSEQSFQISEGVSISVLSLENSLASSI